MYDHAAWSSELIHVSAQATSSHLVTLAGFGPRTCGPTSMDLWIYGVTEGCF